MKIQELENCLLDQIEKRNDDSLASDPEAVVYSQGFLDGMNSGLGVAQLALLKKEAENGK